MNNNVKTLDTFLQYSQRRKKHPLYPVLFYFVQLLASKTQENGLKSIQIRKGKIKLFLFSVDMTFYGEKSRGLHK